MVHNVSSLHQKKQPDSSEMVQQSVLLVQYTHETIGRLIHGLDSANM